MHILIVEDDFISRRLISRYLESYGSCDVAINGEEALEAVKDSLVSGNPYDLICLDIMMPGMDGQETLKALRELEKEHTESWENSKVVMTTSLEDHKSIREAFSSSADGYLLKPIQKKKLIALLTELGLTASIPL